MPKTPLLAGLIALSPALACAGTDLDGTWRCTDVEGQPFAVMTIEGSAFTYGKATPDWSVLESEWNGSGKLETGEDGRIRMTSDTMTTLDPTQSGMLEGEALVWQNEDGPYMSCLRYT